MSRHRRVRLSLVTQLVALLLSFGAIPLGLAIAAGYVVSRDTITEQGERALLELGGRQAVHITAELTRHRLLLRTITGGFGDGSVLHTGSATLARMLRQNLLDDGVFDGLRLVTLDGTVLASVALSDTIPNWPKQAPATAWNSRRMTMHWEGDEAVAYLIAAPVGTGRPQTWLEGHVRSEDFNRIFAMPTHLMSAAEAALFDSSGRLIVVSHDHCALSLRWLNPARRDTISVHRQRLGDTPSLVVTAPVAGTDWVFVAALPLEAVLAPVRRVRNWAVFGTAALVLVIALTAVVASHTVGAPLRDLAIAARNFGRGETYRPLPKARTLEVHSLVAEFNHMAHDLQRSRAEIEQLHDQEMERAQQLATVGELASGVAHEIRNPLTGVLGAVDLALRRLPDKDPGVPLLTEAQQQLRRIEATTEQMLRYARPPELREVIVDPTELIQRASQIVGMQVIAADIEFVVSHTEKQARVRVDPELMVQVLVNLMLNGIQAMEREGGLTVYAESHEPELWLGVRDTGPGIPPEARTEIFRPFYTTKATGTGLGLSISRQIIERHGGSLRVEETPGGGATFVIALPLVVEEEVSRG
jgi:signal transduction histidine kinase